MQTIFKRFTVVAIGLTMALSAMPTQAHSGQKCFRGLPVVAANSPEKVYKFSAIISAKSLWRNAGKSYLKSRGINKKALWVKARKRSIHCHKPRSIYWVCKAAASPCW